ncbi:MAG: MgtC/SapB family protein, partial [Alphaproteobacteria bacterium]
FFRLGVALAIGILVGIERGWKARLEPEGARVAGVRTFTIVGFLGGLWMLLAEALGEVVLGFAFLAFAIVMVVAHIGSLRKGHDYSITTVVASLLTFALGALAVRGEVEIAVAGAVIMTLLLGIKSVVHGWLERVEYEELLTVLKLLVMSLVLLPVLPNKGYGPWQALNPYELWLMVILIAAISFVGYVAVKLAGEKRGTLYASLAGGLASSTAVAFNFSRLAKQNPSRHSLLAVGIVLAAMMMFPRILVVASIIEPNLLSRLVWPLGAATLTASLGAALLWRRDRKDVADSDIAFTNPFEFGTAVKFGILLACVILLVRALQTWFGETGVYVSAFLSGLADVDAITLSLARMGGENLTVDVAAIGILIAAFANTLFKAGLSITIAGRTLALPVGLTLGASILAGFAAAFFA